MDDVDADDMVSKVDNLTLAKKPLNVCMPKSESVAWIDIQPNQRLAIQQIACACIKCCRFVAWILGWSCWLPCQ